MKKALVLGATGGMGSALVKELQGRGVHVHAFARNRDKLEQKLKEKKNIRIFAGDVLQTDELQQAVEGVDVIFHSINIPYQKWLKQHPIIMQQVIEMARSNQSKLVMVDNIYAYGKGMGNKLTEEHLKNPHTKKGKLRLQLQQMIEESDVPYVIAHLPDFYGPDAPNTLLHYTLQQVSKNKKAGFVGDTKIPREYIYIPDGAKAVVELAMRDTSYNQSWNIPATDVITGEEIINLVREITGYSQKTFTISKKMIQFLGLFNPLMREMVEMWYLIENPPILSGEKYEREIGLLPKTTYKEGLRETISSMKM